MGNGTVSFDPSVLVVCFIASIAWHCPFVTDCQYGAYSLVQQSEVGNAINWKWGNGVTVSTLRPITLKAVPPPENNSIFCALSFYSTERSVPIHSNGFDVRCRGNEACGCYARSLRARWLRVCSPSCQLPVSWLQSQTSAWRRCPRSTGQPVSTRPAALTRPTSCPTTGTRSSSSSRSASRGLP